MLRESCFAQLWIVQVADIGGIFAVSFAFGALAGAYCQFLSGITESITFKYNAVGAESSPRMLSVKLSFAIFVNLAALFLSLGAFASENSFEGTVTVTETRSNVATQFLFTRKGDQVRVEHVDKSKPEPVNIVDLAGQKLTIVYPHNSSFMQIDLTNSETQPGAPNLPPGFLIPPPMSQPSPGTRPGPAISPPAGFPTPPPMPSMPPLPNPGVAGPQMPAQAGFGATAAELKKTDKTKKIQGFDCTLYTISDRMERFEIWATSAATLFPFYPLHANYRGRRFGPQMLDEQWIGLLQKQSLFPLEATLKTERGGPERYSFKVDKIDKKKIDNDALFKPPENYHEIQAPRL